MMRTAELMTLAERFGIKFITIRDLQAYRKCHEKLVDQVIMGGVLLGSTLPGFWLGLLLILVFSVYLGWFPV